MACSWTSGDSRLDPNFVTSEDVRSYLSRIRDTFQAVSPMTPAQLHQHFLTLEHNYVHFSADNFGALCHMLMPVRYNAFVARKLNEKLMPPISILDMMRCPGCGRRCSEEENFTLHLGRGTCTCPSCNAALDMEMLAVQAFVSQYHKNPALHFTNSRSKWPKRFPNPESYRRWDELYAYVEQHIEQSSLFFGAKHDKDKVPFYSAFSSFVNGTAYFGTNLVKAMYRQLDFVVKICESPTSIDYWSDARVLHASIERYYKFLSLMHNNKEILSPTVDIDLVWHAHQVQAAKYKQYCHSYFDGHIVNHDDTISSETGERSFARTFLLWDSKYSEPYSDEFTVQVRAPTTSFSRLPPTPIPPAPPGLFAKIGTPMHAIPPQKSSYLNADPSIMLNAAPPSFSNNLYSTLLWVNEPTIFYPEMIPSSGPRKAEENAAADSSGGGCGGGWDGGCEGGWGESNGKNGKSGCTGGGGGGCGGGCGGGGG